MMSLQQQSQEGMSGREETRLPRTTSHFGSQSRIQDSKIIGEGEMMDLRNQLQSEAENIVRWKASTEVKAKNMERDILEKQSIIDDQRTNLMELQLHSEHLSQSLFQERQERELVSTKVAHTRQLLVALQDQYEHLSKTVSAFQNNKDKMQKEHDFLMEKLKGLQESLELQENNLEKNILQAEENVHTFKNAKESWERNIMKKDEELNELNIQVENLQTRIQSLSDLLESTTTNLSSVEKEKTQLCSELDEVKASLVQAQAQVTLQNEKLTEQISRAEEELKLEHEQLMERTKEFQEAVEKIQYLQKANDTLEGAKSELTERVTALAARKQELEEEIGFKENMIQTLQSTQNSSMIEMNELNGRFSEICSQLAMVESEKDTLEQERNTLTDKLQSSKKKITKKKKLMEQFKEQVTTLQSDLEAQKSVLAQLNEDNKNKEEVNHNLEVSLNEINKNYIMCNETLQEMAQKISIYESHEIELMEEKKKMEEELEKVRSDLKTKVQECEELSATVKEMEENVKALKKECDVKIKNVSSETRSKRILEQKIHGLEEKVKKATEIADTLRSELEQTKNVVAEKEKQLEELNVSLDHSICEKQEFQYKYEAKEKSFQTYQNYATSNLETVQSELDLTKNMLEQLKDEYQQQVLQLQEELSKTKEYLNSSKTAHEIQLEEAEKSFVEKNDTSLAQYKDENVSLKSKIAIMTSELEQAKEEATIATKEKLRIKLESDNKVKEMGDLLNIYKTDKEAKLKITEEELQKSQSHNAQLIKEKDELLAQIKTQTENCDAHEKKKAAVTQAMKHTINKISIPASMSPIIKTPSPATYLDTMNTFAEPTIPPPSRPIRKQEADKVQGKPVSSILKTSRRTLLPPDFQKRVVFKPLTPILDFASGDSSSDACTFEVADSDDPFEEIKRARRYPNIRSERLPRANVAPFIPENNIPLKSPTPLTPQHLNKEDTKEPPTLNPSRRKRGRNESQKQSMKTYGGISPKNKQRKEL